MGVKTPFLHRLVSPLINATGKSSSILESHKKSIEAILISEEEQFFKTLEHGLVILEKELENLEGNTLKGEVLFRLYDTFGFPIDFAEEICQERGLNVDRKNFEAMMALQRKRARQCNRLFLDHSKVLENDIKSEFKGYEVLACSSVVKAIYIGGKSAECMTDTDQDTVLVLDQTPFYSESGGQASDTGLLRVREKAFIVQDTQKYGGAIYHIGKLDTGSIFLGENIVAEINSSRRHQICANHSATHLLHSALRQVLGDHVKQKGSSVNDKYLRFDFSHPNAMEYDEILEVEKIVNRQVRLNIPIESEVMSIEMAMERGALALFSNKYGEHVRVVNMGSFSSELCGGTHLTHTGRMGYFHICSESSTAAGIRRIEAKTGNIATTHISQQRELISKISSTLRSNPCNLIEKTCSTMNHVGYLEKEIKKLQSQRVIWETSILKNQAIEVKGIHLIAKEISTAEPKLMRAIVDKLRQANEKTVVVLATVFRGKTSIVVGVSKKLTNRVKANKLSSNLVNQVGGKSGGHAEIAFIGGSDVQGLKSALINAKVWVSDHI
jgi:alanyl-tRNA synthetase